MVNKDLKKIWVIRLASATWHTINDPILKYGVYFTGLGLVLGLLLLSDLQTIEPLDYHYRT